MHGRIVFHSETSLVSEDLSNLSNQRHKSAAKICAQARRIRVFFRPPAAEGEKFSPAGPATDVAGTLCHTISGEPTRGKSEFLGLLSFGYIFAACPAPRG